MAATDARSPKERSSWEKVNRPWVQPLGSPAGQGQAAEGECAKGRERERAAKVRGSLASTREWSTVSSASKMRTEKCPLDLATLRSSVTFVGAVFVERRGGSQIGGGEEWEVMKR